MEDLFTSLEDWLEWVPSRPSQYRNSIEGGNILHYIYFSFMYQCKLCEIGNSCSCVVLGFLLLCNANVFSHCSCCLICLIFMSFQYGHLVMVIHNTCKAGDGSDTRTYTLRDLDLSSLLYVHFPQDRNTPEKYHSSSNSSKKWHEKVLQQDKYPKLYITFFWNGF